MTNAEQISEVTTIGEGAMPFESHLQHIFLQQKAAFNANAYPSYDQRVRDLKSLKKAILSSKKTLLSALEKDFHYRSHDESLLGDIFSSLSSIDYTIKHLRRWMKPQKRHVGVVFQPAEAKVIYQPRGVVGIISPWNYPVFLTIGPLVAAIAAGNRAMIKVSEFTPHTNAVLTHLLADVFAADKVSVVQGETDIAQAFSSLPFDHLLFTGSTQVGRHVMKAAAENLVPVTLELGGKSPVIMDDEMPVDDAVSRFIYGKTMNAGQTCVAPDYIFCPKGRVDELVGAIEKQYNIMYPKHEGSSKRTRIINTRQYLRLKGYIDEAKSSGANVISLGGLPADDATCFMPLTLVTDTDPTMRVMREEIFGPILPIVGYDEIQDVIDAVNAGPRPLGLYIQSFNKAFQEKLLTQTHAGGVCINDAAFHVVVDDLPFGGIGESGMGSYHGIEGFRTFSHSKALLKRGRLFFSDMLFPPYGKKIHELFYRFFIS
ncbi:coniferyl aldehyde dehydrogenase [Enterovibrio sp. ZSDZ35]|uniref:Aldehyde dehydrogenase n=1 Tax=Enterovibrio qingdaonensis TaxID=2899818 RepID=A0ABT5QP73_9GAMM|nr:coniferyl aldehyde dehydrogenase [Enterovibrio sp. ZSDZ35]MDD1782787.1 coniferyl aldehyde dehydrogenase [Enterovibrio sp. ZSDZ35]